MAPLPTVQPMLGIAEAFDPIGQVQPETDLPQPLVTVIIPAFNGANTLDATLRSARAQTHAELEIIVVNDGSTDQTAEIVDIHARQDGRVRRLDQANGGVARARNGGLAAASGAFVAPLDADDLWHPEKIALQVAAIEAAGADCALAYNWYRRIDRQNRITRVSASPEIAGCVLHRHIYWNFIANGSTPLVRAAVAKQIGYDPVLHDTGVQGCEDYLFQLRVARQHRFACVPAFLTGYRVTPDAMSNDNTRMIRSELLAYALFRPECGPSAQAEIDRCVAAIRPRLARNRLRRGELAQAVRIMAGAFALDPAGALEGLRAETRQAIRHRPRDETALPDLSFTEIDPTRAEGPWQTSRPEKRLRSLAILDGEKAG